MKELGQVFDYMQLPHSKPIQKNTHLYKLLFFFFLFNERNAWIMLHRGIPGISNLSSIHIPLTIICCVLLSCFATETSLLVCSSSLLQWPAH